MDRIEQLLPADIKLKLKYKRLASSQPICIFLAEQKGNLTPIVGMSHYCFRQVGILAGLHALRYSLHGRVYEQPGPFEA